MSDSERDARPRISRAELRRLRAALAVGESPFSAEVAPQEQQAGTGPRATILTLCTGNICRSPMGEVLLRAALHDLPVHIHSAGTQALVDHEMPVQAQRLAVAHGADAAHAAAHRGRALDEPALQSADLVLTMAREHRSQAVQLAPAVLHRTFTVREFARLTTTLSDADIRDATTPAGSDQGARLRALARLAGAQRSIVPPEPDNDDVIDPYRRSDETYARSAEQLAPAIAQAAAVVRIALE